MKNIKKRLLSFLIAFAIVLSTINFNIDSFKNVVCAKKTVRIETTVTVNDAIEALIACMNKDYYDNKGGSLEGEAYAAMYKAKAQADIKAKSWRVNKNATTTLKYLGSKVNQALVLMDLGEDPTTYKNVNLISEIAEEISKINLPKNMGINEVKALILLDRYNTKFSNKKVDYNLENAIKNLVLNQKQDGSINNAPQHTATALVVLNKYKDIDGVNNCIAKASDYLYEKYTENGALVNKKFFTGTNAEAVIWFAQSGENLISDKWIKDSKGVIETLFNSWDGKKFVNSTGTTDYTSIPKVLYALVSLEEVGYGDCQIKGVKFDNVKKDKLEKICKANITIVYPSGDKKYDIKFKPRQVTISNKKQSGLTVLGALQASTNEYEAKGKMVTSIFGIKNEGMNGWMYSLNGQVPDTYANETNIKDGDKIVWYYSKNGMDINGPSYEEIVNSNNSNTEQKPEEKASIEPKSVEVLAGESFTLNVKSDKGNYLVYESEIPGVNSGNIKIEYGIKFNIPKGTKSGIYKLKNLAVYNIGESCLENYSEIIKQGLLEKMLKDEENKVADLSNVTVIVKDEEKKTIAVNLAIEGYKGLILDVKDIKAKEDETVENIFERVLKEKKIKYINKRGYISMIAGQKEKDRGAYSGWKYSVNGEFPGVGVAVCTPKDGDKIKFIYVKGYMDETSYRDVDSISLNIDNLKLKVGDTAKLNVTITPQTATNKKVIWISSDDEIVTVNEQGNVKALKEGKAIVKVFTEKTGKLAAKEAECEVIVKAKNKSVIQKDASDINTIIEGVIDYYNNEHFITNQGQLVGYEYSSMYKAGADLSKKQWYLNEKYEPSFDKELKYVGNMADQSLILIDLGKDPNNYDGRYFIDEIAEKINGSNSYFAQREIRGVIALDKYNKKFSDKKVDYDAKHAIEKILESQCEDGGFRERKTSTIVNTGYALMALSKHKDIEGVNEAISKALIYLHDIQKDDGGFYDKSFITGNHVEALRGLIAVGRNPTSKEWTKSSDKNPVDALFILWKDSNSFDAQQGESINNRGWEEATWKALYALVDLKEAGYGEYVVDGVKIKGLNNGEDEKEEKTCKVNVAIALPESGQYISYFKPQEVTISDKKHNKGFTALGALQASTTLYQMVGKMVTSIYGYENKGLNGWMYSVNGVAPDIMAEDYEVKAGDKIIWFYSIGGMDGKKPTWRELTGEKPKDEETKTEEKNIEIENLTTDKEFKLGADAKVTVKATNQTKENKEAALIVGLFNKDEQIVSYGAVEQNIKADEDVKLRVNLSLPKEGEYIVKAFVWNGLDEMEPLSKVIEISVK